MKKKLIIILLLTLIASADELKITAGSFKADENSGISIFSKDVAIKKGTDEINASKVTVYTDKNNEPIKFVAIGNVSFVLVSKQGSIYSGEAQKVIYIPKSKEYYFYKNVHLKQVDQKKEIIGEEVVLKTIEGKAYAKGVDSEPVIMIFNISNDKTKKE